MKFDLFIISIAIRQWWGEGNMYSNQKLDPLSRCVCTFKEWRNVSAICTSTSSDGDTERRYMYLRQLFTGQWHKFTICFMSYHDNTIVIIASCLLSIVIHVYELCTVLYCIALYNVVKLTQDIFHFQLPSNPQKQ